MKPAPINKLFLAWVVTPVLAVSAAAAFHITSKPSASPTSLQVLPTSASPPAAQ